MIERIYDYYYLSLGFHFFLNDTVMGNVCPCVFVCVYV